MKASCTVGTDRGFTITELLVSLAVIAILASLLLAAFVVAKRKARNANCITNLKQHGVALIDFVSTHSVYPLSGNADPKYSDHEKAWTLSIFPRSIFDTKTMICPSASLPLMRPNDVFVYYGYNDRGVIGSYTNAPLGLGGDGPSWPVRTPPVSESQVLNPSGMIAILDAAQSWDGLIEDGETAYSGRYFYARGSMDGNSRMRQRHGGQVQIAFADGHVDRKPMDVVFINANEQGLAMWNRDGKPHTERLR